MPWKPSDLGWPAGHADRLGPPLWRIVFLTCAWWPVVALTDEPGPSAAEPLVVEFEYAKVRQEIAVFEGNDFHVISRTDGGQLRASGQVGRVTDGRVQLVLSLHFDGPERGGRGVSISANLRLGEFTGGMGSVPMGYVLDYAWVRRGIDPLPTLVEALGRRDDDSVIAARQLGRRAAPARCAVAGLVEALDPANSADLRAAAATALGQIGPAAGDAVPMLAEDLDDEQSGEVRVARALALWRICRHADATPTLIGAVSDSHKETRLAALNALGELGVEAPTAAPGLLAALDEPDPRLIASAAAALWATSRDPRAVDALLAFLWGGESGRSHAVEVLGRIGYPAANRATECVAQQGCAAHSGHRWYVARALLRIDPAASQTGDVLAATLRHHARADVGEASEVLATFGFVVLPRLREMLDSDDEYARRLALQTLWRIGVPAVDTLAAALDHRNVEVRRLAADGLRNLGARAAPAVPSLIRALGDVDEDVRTLASFALTDIGRAAAPAVEQALNDPDPRTRTQAEQILREIQAVQKAGENNVQGSTQGSGGHLQTARQRISFLSPGLACNKTIACHEVSHRRPLQSTRVMVDAN